MRKSTRILLSSVAAAVVAACAVARPDQAVGVASGFTSHVVCSGTFVSGLDPDEAYAEYVKPLIGIGLVDWLTHYNVDLTRREVTTTVAGLFTSRAVYQDGTGCLLVRGEQPSEISLPKDVLTDRRHAVHLLPEIAGPGVVEAADDRLRAAVDHAFAEPPGPPSRNTKAVIVIHDGRIIAERYAPGYGVDKPVLGWSASKSVVNALIGILVREGRLSLEQPAPLPAWRDPADPRHAITIHDLLRQTSGLALDETNSGLDPSTRMQFLESDMAGYASSVDLEAKPGTAWAYTDGNYVLLSRILRDAVGGHAEDAMRFAQRELFGPLGMRNFTMEFDATGTPVGSVFMLAPPRDWARLGLLFLNDGVVGGRRILPEGWVRQSTSPTLNADYGAGFWTNVGAPGHIPVWDVPWGMPGAPHDTFFARGIMGQLVVVVPSKNLVVARFGPSIIPGDETDTVGRLIAEVIAVLDGEPQKTISKPLDSSG